MRCSPRSLWGQTLRCLCLTLLFDCVLGSGGYIVVTEAQAGPLYRVEGSELSISCSVTGLPPLPDGRNDFEFRVKKPAKPDFELNIISTNDEYFPFSLYGDRVRSGEIAVIHKDPNSVVFKILHLQKADEGEYDCSVVNTRSTYNGIYSALTTVKVIDNSLSISSSSPASMAQTEGDSLELTCEASTNTIQHTHLSVGFFLRENTKNASLVMSMDKDFVLIPGQDFEQRYKSGLIRLDKIGQVTYRLKISQLKLSDQGALYCEAQEWIQDPDQTWYSIATKASTETSLTVKAKEILLDSESLAVTMSIPHSTLQEGQRLSVSCAVDSQNLKQKFFSLAWLRGGVELARVGPTGVLTVGPDYSSREREGELRAGRIGDRDYSLILQPVRTSDQGEFVCRAWPEERSSTGDFIQGAAQDSKPHAVNIALTESGLSVEMASSVNVNEGDKLVLSCRVSGATGQLSVIWQRAAQSAPFSSLVSLDEDGVMAKAEGSADVRVKALRPASDLFTLELEEATQAAAGRYQCEVSEWKTTNNKASSQVATSSVIVTPLDKFASVSVIGRNHIASEGDKVELICRVRRLKLPRTLTWSVRRGSPTPDNILTLYSNGAISWFGDQHRYQLEIVNKNQQDEMWYHLIISSASKKDAGSYKCSASVVLDKAPKKLSSSELAVNVVRPASDLTLTAAPSIRANINADIELKCSVSSNSLVLSRYAVTWFLEDTSNKTGGHKMIVKSDQNAFVTFEPDLELNQRKRLSVSRRAEGPEFVLSIRNTRSSDRGVYMCEVVQWQQDPSREWHQLPPVSKSTQLSVIEPASDLHLNTTTPVLTVEEGDDVELECNLVSAVDSPSVFYKVIWLYSEANEPIRQVPLVELDHTGLLSYPVDEAVRALQGRLRLLRPAQTSFNLGIHKAHEQDSGTYICRVEQYQLDRDGQWQQKASDETSPMTLNVTVTERSLLIEKIDKEFNISTSQSLTLPCHIMTQSSPLSQFQITWFWRKDTNSEPRPLFTSYRNSTLHYWFGKSDEQLRFGHPLTNLFNLTIVKPSPADSGEYFCEVEEWAPSLSNGWRKVAVEKSGSLTASVQDEGGISEPVCDSPTWIGAFFGVTVLSLLVILLLVLRMCRGNNSAKKKEESLWTENHQLNPKN
ncbi:LOW QUALITY PROTEIN: immunoglobulin superfamily member 3-like [Boleophthalmus pectinirostris]|uniref:LOW QUALITY PROTEIN: immunoglobulin superfamily member 3-like n=1 Tax=Boleophthalmus pectinirostris TaxID=150288 RepID=UPI00242B026C|nr:LOW QUALITY PROTEIN: immunoglobulin superfamily member 3-like [Boleophthalmus pectinirostris]